MSPRKRKASGVDLNKSTQPKKSKNTATKPNLERPPTAEMHRRVLMRSPVPADVVIDWAKRTADSASFEASVAERHLAEVCTPSNFGEWARSFGTKQSTPVWNYLKRGIRNAYNVASWKQKVDGIFAALDCSHTTEDIVPQGRRPNNNLADAELESIVHAVVEFHSDKVRDGDRLGNASRTAQLLGLVQAPRLLKEQITAMKIGSIEKAGVVKTASPSTIRPKLLPVAAILFRSRECRYVETYFSESRTASLTADTMFLASALTYRSQWIVLFETPVTLRLGRRKVMVESVTGTLGDDWVDVRFKAGSSSQGAIPARIPVRFGRRTFEPTTAEHAALVLLDLLFSREENLETSRADGDRVFAEKRLEPIGKSVSTLYRLNTQLRWAINAGTSRLVLKEESSRRAHDVRGHFRVRDGATYPVKPHRRKS